MMICPRDEQDLSDVIKGSASPFAIQGGGTRAVGGIYGEGLSLAALSGITLYEPGALTMVAKAGTPLENIKAALAAENQMLAFEPMDHRPLLGTVGAPTLGGVYATNTSGPRRVQVGAMRDFALGIRFVDGMGHVIKNGGRVMKNVTGYDMVKMMAGTWGTYGVMTEVALKVLPRPEMALTLRLEASVKEGVAALCAALASPYDVSGAAWMDGTAYVRLEGFDASVRYRAGKLQGHLQAFGALDETQANPWADIRDAKPFCGMEGDIWKISVKPTDGPKVVDALPGKAILDWGGGLVWALVPGGTDVRGALSGLKGHATCVKGIGNGPKFAPQGPAIDAITAGLKQKFDPRGILNPGRMG
ncbi:MAG: glycolate oxidase subunit GlcE [Planktomarina sp.]